MKKVKTVSGCLPVEIIEQEIFLKLPFKSLLRFKGVCREWNDILKDSNFVRMHLEHAKQENKYQKLMIYSFPLHEYYQVDHERIRSISSTSTGDDCIEALKLEYPIHNYRLPLPLVTTIAGSVNGLICISSENWDKSSTILVWNPTTRVHKVLPPHPDAPVTGMHGIGFGYNSTSDDYNVVRVVNGSRIDIYSLRSNSWKLVMHGKAIPAHSPTFQKRFRLCSTDGLIYWLASHTPPVGGILKDHFIACFDLNEVDDEEKKNNKLIREIPMPPDFRMVIGFSDLKVLGGCLSVFIVGMDLRSLEILSMMKINGNKNDQVEYRWSNRVMIRETSSYVNGDYRCILPICLSNDGKIVLRIPSNTPTEFVLYNTGTKRIRNLHPIDWISEIGICSGDKVPIEESVMYIQSLVSPIFT